MNVPTFNHQLIQFLDRLHRLPTRPDRTRPTGTSAIPLGGWSLRDSGGSLSRTSTAGRPRTLPWQRTTLKFGFVHLLEIDGPFHVVFKTQHLGGVKVAGTRDLGEVAKVLSRLDHFGTPFFGRFPRESE